MTQKRSVSTSLRSSRRSARLNRDNEKRLRADMVQRRHLLKYIGLILPFRKSISHISFFARKKAGQETDVSVCLLSGCYFFEQLALRAGDTLSYPRTRAGLSSMAFPPRGIRISDGRSCCDFRPRRQRYPLRSVHSDNPLCVITSSQYMRRSQRSSPLHDP